ncbi:MAG: PepSY domain-containing protein [Rhodobacterales bacterium]|nr:PepSY domain-containing protein [Rhodobacterales bacterium]
MKCNLVKTTAAALALAMITMAQPVLASGGDVSQEQRTHITTMLTEQGYDVRKIEMEDGQIEVYALKDGSRFEIYLDADMNIVRTKQK